MNRRTFTTGLAVAAAVVAVPVSAKSSNPDDWFQREREANTFTEDDNLTERLDKLNALMGTDYEIRVFMPDEWRKARSGRKYPLPPVTEAELLAATGPRLIQGVKYEWGVHLRRNGKRWTGNMSPVEYLDWTAQVALGYRLARAQG